MELARSHTTETEGENDYFTALAWTPEGRRATGRPKTTWRRTVKKERNKAGSKSWGIAKAVAQDRKRWSDSGVALRAYWATRLDDDDDIYFI